MPLAEPWTAARAAVWEATTFDGWIRRNLCTRTGRELMQIVAEAVWAAHPADLSFLHVLFYLHAGGGFDSLTSMRGGAQQDRVVGGTQGIARAAASALARPPLLDAIKGPQRDAPDASDLLR